MASSDFDENGLLAAISSRRDGTLSPREEVTVGSAHSDYRSYDRIATHTSGQRIKKEEQEGEE